MTDIRKGTEFRAVNARGLIEEGDFNRFLYSSFAKLRVEPKGSIILPKWIIVNRCRSEFKSLTTAFDVPGETGMTHVSFPEMLITKINEAYCLPFGPPFLPSERILFNDFLIPWAPGTIGWFDFLGNDRYATSVGFSLDRPQCELENAFYIDHSISGHFGHFIGDCLSRLWAWEICDALFPGIAVVVANSNRPDVFQTYLLEAAGVSASRIVKLEGLVRCKSLFLATTSLGVQQYASPTSSRLWAAIRDRATRRDVSLPEKLYFSRRGVNDRPLTNEAQVEMLFERRGFTIVRPEGLAIGTQMALAANAQLVAGCCGSGMFNLAFQGRMSSAFLLASEEYVMFNDPLFSAGRFCNLRYHIGSRKGDPRKDGKPGDWYVDAARLEADIDAWLVSSSQ